MDTFKFGWRIQNATFTNIPVSNIIWQWISIQPNEVVIVIEIMKSNLGPGSHNWNKFKYHEKYYDKNVCP